MPGATTARGAGTPSTTGSPRSGGFWSSYDWRDLVELGGGLASGAISASSARSTNSRSIALAREQMEFQERMSSTAYQRSAKDLEAAGLNRILALGSPATTPGGAQPPKLEVPGRHAREGIATALQVALQKAQIRNLEADAQLKGAQAGEATARTGKVGHEISEIAARIGLTEEQTTNAKETLELIKGQAKQAREMAKKLAQEARSAGSAADKAKIEAELYQKLYGGDWGAALYYMKEMAIPLAMIGSSVAFGAARIPGAKTNPTQKLDVSGGRRIPKMKFTDRGQLK